MDRPKHRKYTSIDPYKGNVITRLGCDWVVLEKIHGANFSIYVYENEILAARRSDYVDKDEFFYDHKRIINELTPNLRLLHKAIGDYVIVGELFGGIYSHPDVPKSETAVKTQNGIHYSPENQFIAFDLRKDGIYYDFDKAEELFKVFNIPHLTPLFQGSIDEAFNFNQYFQTTIPERYGLPPIKDNEAEGVIIRPIKESLDQRKNRIIYKKKTAKYSEVKAKKHGPSIVKTGIPDKYKLVTDYLTDSRAENVRSHFGDKPSKGELIKAYVEDVLKDFQKDHGEISDKDAKQIRGKISKEACAYMSPYF
jgi:Rnl2 family RNA ligase